MIPAEIRRVAEIGWHVYPMSPRSKAGAFEGAHAAATADIDQIERWAQRYPDAGWRVVCGPSGLFALDVDRPGTHKADGFSALRDLAAANGPLPERPMTRTGGSGGAVLFFHHAGEPIRGWSGSPAPGLDPHRGQQAIVLPPSKHPITGGSYTWRIAPWDCAPPPIPEWLATLLAPPPPPPPPEHDWIPSDERARNAMMRATRTVQDAPSGLANDTLNRQAYKLGCWCGAGLLSEHEAASALYFAAHQRKIPPHEAKATIRSGINAGRRNPVQPRYAGGR